MATKVIQTSKQPPASSPKRNEKLPHERDESVGSTDGIASGTVQQAHRDVSRGLQDTDRGPVTDKVYRKLKQ